MTRRQFSSPIGRAPIARSPGAAGSLGEPTTATSMATPSIGIGSNSRTQHLRSLRRVLSPPPRLVPFRSTREAMVSRLNDVVCANTTDSTAPSRPGSMLVARGGIERTTSPRRPEDSRALRGTPARRTTANGRPRIPAR